MQFLFSDASAVQVVKPTVPTRNGKATATAHKQSLHAIANDVSLDKAGLEPSPSPEANQPPRSALAQTEPVSKPLTEPLAETLTDPRSEPISAPLSEPLSEALTEPLTVVKQTIDDLEAQGLLMVFDRHDQVAKRLTDNLVSAGVLLENPAIEQPIEPPETTPLLPSEEAD